MGIPPFSLNKKCQIKRVGVWFNSDSGVKMALMWMG